MNYPIVGNVSLGNVSGNIKLYINDSGSSNLTGIGYNNNSMTFGVNQSLTATPEMVINPSGNVGIGTTNPVYPLDVTGNIRLGVGTTGNIRFGNSGIGTTQAGYIDLISNNMTIMNHQNGNIVLGANNAERMRIASNGNVGIGTTNPHMILDVSGGIGSKLHNLYINQQNGPMAIGAYPVYTSNLFGTGFALYQGVAGDTVLNAASGQPIDFKISNENKMRISLTGNVGIGTTNPAYTLDVGGTIRTNKLLLNNSPMIAYQFVNTTQSVNHNATTTIIYPTADTRNGSSTGIGYDTSNGIFTNNNAYAVTLSVSACIAFTTNASGIRIILLETSVQGRVALSSITALPLSEPSCCNISGIFVLNTNETFTVKVFQNSGVTLTLGNVPTVFTSRVSVLVM
jgi:hypothetical protein